MSIRMEVWGPWALFTRPEMKAERVTYDVPTPSAARGMLESVYYHPGMKWRVDKIYILNPIQFSNLRRNEVDAKVLASDIRSMAVQGEKIPYLAASAHIQQRSSLMLRDVHYVIEAHFDMTDKAAPSDNPGKFQDSIKRRLRKGQCYSQPYFGCRECTAHFALWEGEKLETIQETRDLGWMLYDLDYSDLKHITPMFFRAKIIDGVMDVRNCEVVR